MKEQMTCAQAHEYVNKHLKKTITRQQFATPWRLLLERNGMKPLRRQRSFVPKSEVEKLRLYMRKREQLVNSQVWARTRPYNSVDFDNLVNHEEMLIDAILTDTE